MSEHTGAITHLFNAKNLGTFKSSGVATFESGVIQSNNLTQITAATATLTSSQSGSIIYVNKADGCTITLPTAAAGLRYKIIQGPAVSGGTTKIITASASQFLKGTVLVFDNDTTTVFAGKTTDGATDVSLSLNGTTKGGLLGGDFIEFIGISSTQWLVSGVIVGNGTIASPFANS